MNFKIITLPETQTEVCLHCDCGEDGKEIVRISAFVINLVARQTSMLRTFVIFLLFITLIPRPAFSQKQISITVDDLPVVSDFPRADAERDLLTRRLILHLQKHRVPAVGFVIGEKLMDGAKVSRHQMGLLELWLKAGFELGNHTFSHASYNDLSAADYQKEILMTDTVLKPLAAKFGKPTRYFRHPYLARGNTAGKLDSLKIYLAKRGYQEAPVTINDRDYLFSSAYEKALFKHDTLLAENIGSQYIEHMLASVHFYESQADSIFHRPIPHVLLTHANLINSVFLDTLLSQLEEEGYQFVTLENALKDPVYQSPDRFIGREGISWIQRWALTQGKPESFCDGEPEVPGFVKALAE